MKHEYRKLFYWIAVLLWLGVIFWFSSQPDLKSSLETFWDIIFRKIAHISEYFVLTYLFFQAVSQYKLPIRYVLLFSVVFSIFFAGIDEIYQTSITGRSGNFRDVAIDSLGIGIAALLLLFYNRKGRNNSL